LVLGGTYFEQMAHWLARERNYYCCIQEVKFASFWLLSVEPTEIIVAGDSTLVLKSYIYIYIYIYIFPYILLEETFILHAILISVDILNGLPIQSLMIPCRRPPPPKKLLVSIFLFLSFVKDTYENLKCVGGRYYKEG
jgi:hypothetical protein